MTKESPQEIGTEDKKTKKVLLVVTRCLITRYLVTTRLTDEVEVQDVQSIEEAVLIMKKRASDFEAIIIGRGLPVTNGIDFLSSEDCTPGLVRHLSERYSIPIIATLDNQEYQDILMKAGCNHQLNSDSDITMKIREVLEVGNR